MKFKNKKILLDFIKEKNECLNKDIIKYLDRFNIEYIIFKYDREKSCEIFIFLDDGVYRYYYSKLYNELKNPYYYLIEDSLFCFKRYIEKLHIKGSFILYQIANIKYYE